MDASADNGTRETTLHNRVGWMSAIKVNWMQAAAYEDQIK